MVYFYFSYILMIQEMPITSQYKTNTNKFLKKFIGAKERTNTMTIKTMYINADI